MKRHGEIYYPTFINEAAIHIGRLRSKQNNGTRANNQTYDFGKNNVPYDILGVKGEMIAQMFFFSNFLEYEPAPLFAENPVIGYDIKTKRNRIDVKTINEGTGVLSVNKRAHEGTKGITAYLFIKPLGSKKALYWFVPFKEVSTWKQNLHAKQPYYYKAI